MNTNNTQNTLMDSPEALGHALCNLLPEMVQGFRESAIAVRLSSAFETLCAYCAENMIDTPRDFMAGLVCQLESTARSLRSTFDLPDEPTGNAAPSWLTEPTPQINGLEA